MLEKLSTILVVLIAAQFAAALSPPETCDLRKAIDDCENRPDLDCYSYVINEETCEVQCDCMETTPSECNDDDIERMKKTCLQDETQLCAFNLFDTATCATTCECLSQRDANYTKFCNFEEKYKECTSRPDQACLIAYVETATCRVDCSCTATSTPEFECPLECPVNDEIVCTKFETPGDVCPFSCGCVSADPPSFSCDDYVALEEKSCQEKSSGSRICKFLVGEDKCSGECRCDKRKRCFPVV
jgi:hypothetical protein